MAMTKNGPDTKISLKVKISVLNERGRGFLGPGHYSLLRRIDSLHSISEADRELGMSYSKSHRLICDLEKNVGRRILVTHIGGMDRGGAELTPFARSLLTAYEQFLEKVRKDAEKHFRDLEKLLSTKLEEEK
jgi:molybdate transport system regulatory protein